jgi:hypothetical protein
MDVKLVSYSKERTESRLYESKQSAEKDRYVDLAETVQSTGENYMGRGFIICILHLTFLGKGDERDVLTLDNVECVQN